MIKSALEKVISEDLSEIWTILNSEEKRRIIDAFVVHNYKKNQMIYAEGEEPEFIWCLLSGKVKKFKDGIGGRQQILRLIRPVQYFGYRAYFASEVYNSSAAAIEPSVVGTIPMKLVEEMINANVKLAWFFIQQLSHDLGGSDRKIVNLTQKHIRGRLAEALIVLRDHYGFE
nr:Crp/Fnr family transcriptional regulator [Muribaculaceae bacterium]